MAPTGVFSPDVTKGSTEIRSRFRVKARPEDLPRTRKPAEFSPVFDTLTRAVQVVVDVQQA